ncbi:T9SS type A sorting domain-containing protein [Polaribacter sp.]|nr:T9SS type A sorting domain-containing protein [Polaribacter sp.]
MKKMKKKLLLSIVLFAAIALIYNAFTKQTEIEILREKHTGFLAQSPFKETLKLSKKERKAIELTPNKFYERQWELTLNPATGKPEPEKLLALQERLRKDKLFSKVPGDGSNSWTERGPDNQGGRTRAIMFDPNDVNGKRVFAGGVSGGLWLNTDITDVNSAWAEVGIPANLAISVITHDPNNTMTFYVGTGESYTNGDANGNGVWKSTNGGQTWVRIFGGEPGETYVIPDSGTPTGDVKVTVNSPSSIVGNYFGLSGSFGADLTPISGTLVLVDDGSGNPNEGCSSLTNGAAISGNIAVVFRGSCNFSSKALNAQNEGALAVIVVNNASGPAVGMASGDDGDQVTIPTFMLSQADGQAIINELASGVTVDLESIPLVRDYSGYTAKPGVQHINDIKVRDIGGGNSEIYIAAGTAYYRGVFLGPEDFGLFKSVNSGDSWSKLELAEAIPNDIEIGADNAVWVATTNNSFGDEAGEIFSSTDGTTFALKHKVADGLRTQIAVSSTNASLLYVLVGTSSAPVEIIYTDDAFATTTSVSLPNDADNGIPADDFTRGQAFYDLMIEVDPNNDNVAYVGGIDLFKTTDSGGTWEQISKWSNNNNLASLNVSQVHADQHALTFLNNSSSIMMFSNDGGVYYSNDAGANITSRSKNYNTLQFYKGAIGQEVGANEKLLAGAQDNGSQLINNASAGINSANKVTGGDGAYCFIDKDNEYMITSYVYNNFYYLNYATGAQVYSIDSDSDSGDFINPSALDSNTDNLYTNGSSGTTYQVNRYSLASTSATKYILSDALLDAAPTVFKPLASTFFHKNVMVGTENGRLFTVKLNDSGATWTEITGANFVGSISSIALGDTEQEIYITFYNYGVSSVFYSSNGGASWQDKEGDFPDISIRAIMANPLNSNEVIIGTDLGVWGTDNFSDASPNWMQAYNGMKDVPVHSFDLRTADNTVLAATHGRGLFTGQFTSEPSTLSIDNIEFDEAFSVYPTVSKGNITVFAKSSLGKVKMNIFDISGRQVHNEDLDFGLQEKQKVSLNLNSGIYFVNLIDGNGKKSSKKIVIQ